MGSRVQKTDVFGTAGLATSRLDLLVAKLHSHGWYKGTITMVHEGEMRIKISSRLLQEYLVGRLDAERFKIAAFRNHENLFDVWLERGQTIQGATFEGGGVDEDGDYVILDFGADWAAKSLRS